VHRHWKHVLEYKTTIAWIYENPHRFDTRRNSTWIHHKGICRQGRVRIYGSNRCYIYGLSQSGYLANQDLIKNLAIYGYHPVKRTPGLWKHETRRTTFTLVVDDFGVQYFNKEDADHLISSIEANYPVKTDWTGSKYIGIDLDWDYTKREVKLSMKGYVKEALKEYQHTPPPKPFDALTKYHKLEFGQKIQYERTDESKPLSPKQIKTIHKKYVENFYAQVEQ
jgi:hypothetical protein